MSHKLSGTEKRELNNLYQVFDSRADRIRRRNRTFLYLGILEFIISVAIKETINSTGGLICMGLSVLQIMVCMITLMVVTD